MIEYAGRQWGAQEFAVCMATDAFRAAIGIEPKTFSLDEIKAWLDAMRSSCVRTEG